MSHICMRLTLRRIRGSRTAPSAHPSLYLYCKIASWEDHKKHSIFLALILVPKYTPYALLVWSNIKSDQGLHPFFLNRYISPWHLEFMLVFIFSCSKNTFFTKTTQKRYSPYLYIIRTKLLQTLYLKPYIWYKRGSTLGKMI